MVKVGLASRSDMQLDLMEEHLRRTFDVQGETEHAPAMRGRKRRYLSVRLPDPPPEPRKAPAAARRPAVA